MRIEGELLSQIQAAFFRRDNAFLRLQQQKNVMDEAEAVWQRLGRVIENKFGIELGKTHWVDLETGEINKLATVDIPPQAPATPPPPQNPTKKRKGPKAL